MRANLKLAALTTLLALAACGGGGGGGGTAGSAGGGTTTSEFVGTGPATVGELVQFTVNANRTAYSYRILQSEFGLAGTQRSGTLTDNGDGTYTPSGDPSSYVVLFDNGLTLGFIRESINGTTRSYPVLTGNNTMLNTAQLDGIYNYAGGGCVPQGCEAFAGTIRIASGTWRSCFGEDYSDTCPDSRNGTINSLGNGQFQFLRDGAVNAGTGIVLGSGNNRTLLLDLQDFRTGGIGRGILLGPLQRAQTSGEVDGVYIGFTTTNEVYAAEVSGNNVRIRAQGGQQGASTLSYNNPFNGITQVGTNSFAVLGQGLYVSFDNDFAIGGLEFGLKLPAAFGNTFEQVAANSRSTNSDTTVSRRTTTAPR